jgi:group I intron endonuclease
MNFLIPDEFKRTSGVYAILKGTEIVYIGSTVEFYGRFHAHKSELFNGRHGNSRLQNSFSNNVNLNFSFEMLEVCSKDVLRDREQYYIDHFGMETLYNLKDKALSCTGAIGSEKRISSSNKSGKKGVFVMSHGKYRAALTCERKFIYLGDFDLFEDASLEYDTFVKDREEHGLQYALSKNKERKIQRRGQGSPGISFHSTKNKYCVKPYAEGKQHYVGYFKDLREAISARDKFLADFLSVKRHI